MDVDELESAVDSAFQPEFDHEIYQMSLSARFANVPELLGLSPFNKHSC